MANEPSGTETRTGHSQVDNIYNRSQQAAGLWGKLPLAERIAHLKRLRLLVVERRDDITQDIALDTGKPQTEAMATEVFVVTESILYTEKHARRALKTQAVKTPLSLFGKKSYVEYKPRGVVLVISPWNFPFQLTMIPIVEALAAGNAVIVKPSELTPRVTERMRQLFREAGFPSGVVQVVEGGPEVGADCVKGKPDFIHFTGSVRTGRRIQMEAARELIPTTLELGGKDPMIVFADANLDRAVHGALWGGFANSGQICMSVERLYVERAIYDRFVEKLTAEAAKLRQGRGPEDDIGSMTSKGQVGIVRNHIESALHAGAQLRFGATPELWNGDSLQLVPMIVTGVHSDAELLTEETFGPVLPILAFDTEEQAIALANDSRFGLSASVWSANLERAKRVARRLVSGNVVINDVLITIANPHLPYGGVKEGGIGRYHSVVGLQAFSIQTSVMVDRGRRTREISWFPYQGKYQALSTLVESLTGKRMRPLKVLSALRHLMKQSK